MNFSIVHRVARLFVAITVGVLLFLTARTAEAYPWMLRHEYTGCAQCHVDPSGAGLLTLYGRAQSEVLLRSHYTAGSAEEDPVLGGFVFGAIPLPEKGFRAQVDARAMTMRVAPPAPAPVVTRTILMQADAMVGIELPSVRGAAQVGYVHEGALAASVTHGLNDRVVSRQHWLGITLDSDDQVLARAGRMNLPFGLRILEHTMAVRSETRTDINAAQQHGVAVGYSGEKIRGEAMAVLGNFQLSPDDLRERGYAGYAELVASPTTVVGASSMILHTDYDLAAGAPSFRQAHGIFGRMAIAKPLVVMAETDLLVRSPRRQVLTTGLAGLLQADFEPWQGLHFIGSGELVDRTLSREPVSYGAWLSTQWFFLPHVDVRFDFIWQSVAQSATRSDVTTLLGQIHAFL